MKVLKKFNVTDDIREIYRFTHAQTKRFIDISGTTIQVDAWCLVSNTEKLETGEVEEKTILFVKAGEDVFATGSGTFISAFEECIDTIGEDVGELTIRTGRSKAGREFVECTL